MSGTYFNNDVSIAYQSTPLLWNRLVNLINVKIAHFSRNFTFSLAFHVNVIFMFGWSLEIQVIYIKRGYGSLYEVKMMNDFEYVMQILYI